MNHTPAKPIEPGCLAMIINAKELTGLIVTVVEYIGKSKEFLDPDLWLISVKVLCPHGRLFTNLVPAINLTRLDDPSIQKQIESEREKEHA